MSLNLLSRRALRASAFRTSQLQPICARCRQSTAADPAAPSPLRKKLQDDLKQAMRQKNAAQLSVIRALLSAINNSFKTAKPVDDDAKLLSLVQKKIAESQEAQRQFTNAQRPDLAAKEKEQIAILEEYAGNVQTVPYGEIRQTVQDIVDGIKAESGVLKRGVVLKRVIGLGGVFEGKPVDKTAVLRVVSELVPE